MSLSRVATRSRLGLNAVSVQVEVHLSPGLPAIAMVGMPESVMREAKERVRSAVISSGFRWPDSRLTINIAPASTPKSGASFDLAIAIAVLIASGQLSSKLAESAEFYGELSLSGDVLSTSGLLAAAGAIATQPRDYSRPELMRLKWRRLPNMLWLSITSMRLESRIASTPSSTHSTSRRHALIANIIYPRASLSFGGRPHSAHRAATIC